MQQEPREGNTFAYPVQGAGVWLASPPPPPPQSPFQKNYRAVQLFGEEINLSPLNSAPKKSIFFHRLPTCTSELHAVPVATDETTDRNV